MYRSIIKGDMLKSKVTSLITGLFITCAAMLVSLTILLGVNLFGAIDHLMTRAKTPHFMQMHSGDLQFEKLKEFVRENDMIADFQVLEFLNVDGVNIVINGNSLADSVQDNGFSIQSEHFDYLLDLDDNIIIVNEGEVYLPITYMKEGRANIGDELRAGEVKLIVSGFLRDSQMNSDLCLSKRFLVSQKDYEKLKTYGQVEYLIEFLLKDIKRLSEFEAAYHMAQLDTNGPVITYPLFKMINAISDGIMIAVILLISLLVVIVSLLCIRFTLLAKIEEEYKEIGVMKAIGLRTRDIKKIYLAKYALIAGVSSILGFGISFLFQGMLLANIRLFMGESKQSGLDLIFQSLGAVFIFAVVIFYVNYTLERFRKISAVKAIRFGVDEEEKVKVNNLCLSSNKLLPVLIFLAVRDILMRKKVYATMLIVLSLCTFIMIVPQNLYTTISSRDFIRYMGIGNCSVRMDIQQVPDILGKSRTIENHIKNDKDIANYTLLITKSFEVKTEEGMTAGIKVELGDHAIFPVEYIKGRMPQRENEIALSVINSDELGKDVGDEIIVWIKGKEKKLLVSGIYSDVTNGGKSAKAVFEDEGKEIMWATINIALNDPRLLKEKVKEYADLFDYAKVYAIDTYIMKVFGQVIKSVSKAAYTGMMIALMLTFLITLLFMKMLIAKDRCSITVLKAIGFRNSDIMMHYVTRAGCILVLSVLLGTILANTLGKGLMGMMISLFGAASFKFTINPLSVYLLSPLMFAASAFIATLTSGSSIEKIKISEYIKE